MIQNISELQLIWCNESLYNKTTDCLMVFTTMKWENVLIRNYLIPFLNVISVIVIFITLFIIHKKKLWFSTRIYLTALGLVDILGLVILTIISVDYFLINFTINMFYFYRINAYLNILFDTVLLWSNWLTTIFGVERYVVVLHPFITKRITNSHRKIIILTCFIGSSIFKVPGFILLINQEKIVHNNHLEINKIEIQNNLNNLELWQSWIVDFGLFLVVPFTILIFVNARLILTVRRSSRLMRQYCLHRVRKIEYEERKITCIMICVIMTFFICQGPFVMYTALSSVNLCSKQTVFQSLSILILSMKSDFNFVLHCWMCEKFKASFRRICCHATSFRDQGFVSNSLQVVSRSKSLVRSEFIEVNNL